MITASKIYPYLKSYHTEKYFNKEGNCGSKEKKTDSLNTKIKTKIKRIVRGVEFAFFSKKYYCIVVLIKPFNAEDEYRRNNFYCCTKFGGMYVQEDLSLNDVSENIKYSSLLEWIEILDIDFEYKI